MKTLISLFFSLVFVFFSSSSSCAQITTLFSFKEYQNFRIIYSTQLQDKWVFISEGNFGNANIKKLWTSDGTPAGTHEFMDVPSQGFQTQDYIKLGDELFYVVLDYSTQKHTLWKTNGTREGTIPIKEIHRYYYDQTGYDSFLQPNEFTVFKGLLYFIANGGGTKDRQLWRSDGTPEGTFAVYTLPEQLRNIYNLRAGTNKLFFISQNDTAPYSSQLWVSDGETADTVRTFKTILSFYYEYALSNDVIFFVGFDPESGTELWKSDGTAAGTQLVKDLTPGNYDYDTTKVASSSLSTFINFQNKVYFVKDNWSKAKLYSTDGTEGGTLLVKDFSEGQNDLGFAYISRALVAQGRLYLVADNGETGAELWIKDQNSEEFSLVKDIRPGKPSSFASFESFEYNQQLYFYANDGVYGLELWKTDGSPANTQLVADLTPGSAWTFPSYSINPPVVVQDKLLFFNLDQNKKTQLNALDLNADFPAPQTPIQYAENEWFRNIGNLATFTNSNPTWSDELVTDSKNNIYVSGKSFFLYYGLSFFENQKTLYRNPGNDSGGNFIAKFDQQGNLLWAKHVGGSNAYESNTLLAVNPKDHLVIANTFYGSAGFDSLTINTYSSTMYMAQYTSAGKLIWINTFPNRGRFNKIQTDQEGNIYAGGLYYDNFLNLSQGVTLESIASPQYFIAKFDPQGNALWAKNIDHIGDSYGKIADLKISADNRIYALVTQGTIRTASSCKFQNWGIKVDSYQPDGTQNWSKTLYTDDLSVARSLDISPLGDVFVAGRFRGTLTADERKLSTQSQDGCNLTSSFLVQLNGKNGKVIKIYSDNPRSVDLHQVLFDREGNYFLMGTENEAEGKIYEGFSNGEFPSSRHHFFVRKFDLFGNLLQERKLYTNINFLNDEPTPRMAIDQEDYLLLSGSYLNQLDTIPNCISASHNEIMFLMRFKQIEDHFVNFPEKFTEGITLAPNPTQDVLYIVSPEMDFTGYELKIHNALGQEVSAWKKTGKYPFARIDLSNLSTGLYILTFSNGSRKIIKRVIKN